jgi:uncharacterized protein YbaR (Trm112 family)
MADPNEPQSPPTASDETAKEATAADKPARPAPRLLEILVCPLTKSTLELSRDHSELISRRARLAYPIRDGIPLLTSETARELTDDELKAL